MEDVTVVYFVYYLTDVNGKRHSYIFFDEMAAPVDKDYERKTMVITADAVRAKKLFNLRRYVNEHDVYGVKSV